MPRVNPPYRADIVGSFLRPEAVHQARAEFFAGKITREELAAVEDREIAALIKQEQVNGIQAVTDGEFRRSMWHMDFLQALSGVETVYPEHYSVEFKGKQPHALTVRIVDRIGFPADHPFLEAFDRLKALAGDTPIKFTIPSPSMLHVICCVREANYQATEYYADDEKLFEDMAQCWTDAVKALYARGVRYLQFDDTSWGNLCAADMRRQWTERGIDLDRVAKKYVEVINKVVENKPADMTLTMHICRGNFRSTWFSSGGYEPVAETLFGHCNVDGFFLEYDTDRAGSFEPLRFIKNQTVVLGLVSSKLPELEEKDAIKARIEEATKYVPLDQLCLSPQCGFASTEEGNLLTQDDQWAKIRLCVEVAKEVWADA